MQQDLMFMYVPGTEDGASVSVLGIARLGSALVFIGLAITLQIINQRSKYIAVSGMFLHKESHKRWKLPSKLKKVLLI